MTAIFMLFKSIYEVLFYKLKLVLAKITACRAPSSNDRLLALIAITIMIVITIPIIRTRLTLYAIQYRAFHFNTVLLKAFYRMHHFFRWRHTKACDKKCRTCVAANNSSIGYR